MKKNKFLGIIALAHFLLLFNSCNIGGLDLQKDVKYNATPLQPNLNMSAYQFIQSRKAIDMFMLAEAIDRAGYRDSFEVSNRTYIVMNDLGFAAYLTNKKYADVAHIPVDVLQLFLKQRTIIGQYSSLDLTTSAKAVQTSDPATLLILSLYVPSATDDANKYKVAVSQNVTPLANKEVMTSNLKATNGIIHVIQQQL